MTSSVTGGEGRATLLEEAAGWVREAGELTLRWFRSGVTAERKADDSPVTVADREAETLLRARISARFPDDGLLGEEFGEERPFASRRWILDPIDGTKSFLRGVPLYAVLLALEERVDGGVPDGAAATAAPSAAAGSASIRSATAGDAPPAVITLALLHFPALGETLAATRGGGTFWNGVRARVSTTARLADALLLTTSARPPDGVHRAGWDRLADGAGVVRTWGDAYGHALVATGRAEIMVDPRLALWDVAPLVLAVEEAGGVFSDLEGRNGHFVTSGMATNAALAGEARRLFGMTAPGEAP